MKKWIVIVLFSSLFFACCDEDIDPGKDLTYISYSPTAWSVELPAKWPQLEIPVDNPMTEEGIDLGRHLFYDNILSADGTQSCSSCHLPSGVFTDNLAVSVGIDGIAGTRSAMSLVNIGLVQPLSGDTLGMFFWDGRSQTLETQALAPVEDPIELHNEWPTVIKDLQASAIYPEKFRKAFGITTSGQITKELAAKAIAQFERTLLSYNSLYDRYDREEAVLSEEQLEGLYRYIDDDDEVNFKHQMECSHCHPLPTTTSNDFENNALQTAETLLDFADVGRGKVTGILLDNGKMRVPTLRNIMLSAPYMHDGSLATIDDVIDHYLTGGHASPSAHSLITDSSVEGEKDYNEDDRRYIKAFLETLTDTAFLNNKDFQSPF